MEGATQSCLDEAPEVGESGPTTTTEVWVEVGEAQVEAVETPMRVTRAAVKAKVVVTKVKRAVTPIVGTGKGRGSCPQWLEKVSLPFGSHTIGGEVP